MVFEAHRKVSETTVLTPALSSRRGGNAPCIFEKTRRGLENGPFQAAGMPLQEI
jgi:hypothetical protein